MQQIIRDRPYLLTQMKNKRYIRFVTNHTVVHGQVPQRMIIDGNDAVAKQPIHACFSWVMHERFGTRGSYLRSLNISYTSLVSFQECLSRVNR